MKALWLAFAFAAAACAQNGTFGATGQQAVTASAAVLVVPSSLAVVCVKALSTNTIAVWVGATAAVTTSTGYPLSASESTCVATSAGKPIYVIASTTGASVAFLGQVQ